MTSLAAAWSKISEEKRKAKIIITSRNFVIKLEKKIQNSERKSKLSELHIMCPQKPFCQGWMSRKAKKANWLPN